MFWHINTSQYFFTYLNVDFYRSLSLILDVSFNRENDSFILRIRTNCENILKRNDIGFIEKDLEIEVLYIKVLYPTVYKCQVFYFRGNAQMVSLMQYFNLIF